jgi:membrane fusion protein, multidrug efflux system
MRKRMTIMLAVMGLFIATLGTMKFLQIRAAIAAGSSWAPPPEAVTTVVTQKEEWPATLSAIGSAVAVNGVVVSADLPGIVDRIDFDSGRHVVAGQMLVQLDVNQEKAQLAAAEAQRKLAAANLSRADQLLQKGVLSEAEHDRMEAEASQAEAQVGEIKATIERKRIRAPFDGVLGIRQVNRGQYLNGGAAVVPLQSMDPIYVNFSLPQQEVTALQVGQEVKVSTDSVSVTRLIGKITAINSVIDEATRNVQVQATLRNPSGKIRPGMFVNVQVVMGASQPVIALPASAVNYAPYGNSVFVVEQMQDPKSKKPYRGVRQQFVKLGEGRGDQVAVLSGLKPGDEVVTSGVFKLRNGAPVMVDNKTVPANNPAAKPEDS